MTWRALSISPYPVVAKKAAGNGKFHVLLTAGGVQVQTRGFNSSTSQLSLSRFRYWNPASIQRMPPKVLTSSPKVD